MTKQITIAPAEAADVQFVHQFIDTLEGVKTGIALFEDIFIHNLNQHNIIYLVAKINDKVVGFISAHGQLLLHHTGYVYEIQELFVHENYRRCGIGKALLNSVVRNVKLKNAVALEVTANKIRENAHHFYSNNGFTATHIKFTKSFTNNGN